MADDRVTLVIPTAVNILCAVADNLTQNARQGVEPQVDLPSMRRRAYMIVNETGVIPVRSATASTVTTKIRGT